MSSDLCSACGLCCDGTLYGRLVIDAAEATRLRHLRLPLLRDGEQVIVQPCAAHGEGGCTIYAERPRCCAEYQCTLYRKLDAGEVSYTDALARVREARALAEAVRALLPAGQTAPLIDALAAILGGRVHDADARRENGELLLAAATLAAVCRRDLDARFGRPRDERGDDGP